MTAVRVCSLADLTDRVPVAFQVGDEQVPVVLVRQGDAVHALRDECSHAAISLSEGEVTRKGIECWLHGSCFDLATGKPSSPPASDPVDVFAVELRGGDVHVDVTTTTN
ncbi:MULTISPECIES: non-heme iron oxygenase ferredoxin subunit [Actinosynnema]|uniref:Rieske (2Fe-2S) domain protein n=3 Tax=Actinosynnema TaxID=40566 RepID=C6W8C6_ACTMD|nr:MULTISPECIES: non-heme iron oxygenase ferredoxin subunit [Actinosynnema]ACU38973.1 Rieske (2Fe-2S) domain protein [Actinosynnema mirum DSM 43827]AXX32566.1 Ferredoxin, 2Fe-2S [Actinosynnema pretiosum subsp. pretiosum]MCP2099180.1 3-phenylpropionate/trans-cinnamate dioxygenase ferredoxin subunit [Actinosynnema pretiosum]QUF03532.1 non-heme iron oxygenase ferredoxin subunit [Actinosynnema pretiosum subsp. pretiosum]